MQPDTASEPSTARRSFERSAERGERRPRVACLFRSYPHDAERHELFELLALDDLGLEVHGASLRPARRADAPPEPRRARLGRTWKLWSAQAHWLLGAPGAYLSTVAVLAWRGLVSRRPTLAPLAALPRAARVARELRKRRIEHVHAYGAGDPALAALIVRRLAGIRFSFTARGPELHADPAGLAWRVAECEFAVAPSEHDRALARRHVAPEVAHRLRVIHRGVDPAVPARTREPAAATLELLCVADLREGEGHRQLVEACRRLVAGGVPVRCHLVGVGPHEAAIREEVERAGLDTRVRFHGALPRGALLERMLAAHVLVAPRARDAGAAREVFSRPLLEAMRCGLPVVATRVAGIGELIEHDVSGLLVPPGDARPLAAALQRLAALPTLRARLGAGARARVESQFDLRTGAQHLAREIRQRRREAERRRMSEVHWTIRALSGTGRSSRA